MAIPSLLSMAVDGSTLALYFSEPIKSILPSRNRFQVLVNGVRNYTSANATLTNGDTIRLALNTPIPAGATVSVSYLNVNGFDGFGYGDIRSISSNQTAAFFRSRATSNLTGTPAASVAISSSTASLKGGETATITFSFSRDPGSSFVWDGSSGDVSVSGGTLSALSGSGLSRTAVFTPTTGSSGGASITVAGGTYTDLFGNNGSAGTTPALTYDTLAPTLAITSSSAALIAGQTATITFTFSEDPGSSFVWDGTTGDVVVSGGTLSAISGSGLTRTATFTADSSGTASISVVAGSYTDAVGNAGGASFHVGAGTFPISSLASGDVLAVASGATANATSGTNGFTANSQTANAGTINLTTAGYAVNLANASGPNGYALTNTGAAVTLTGSAFHDTLTGGAGNDTLNGGGGNDIFNVNSGSDTITDFGGSDVLVVSNGATANATVTSAFTATASTSNAGTATLTSAGYGVTLSSATGSNGYTVTNTGVATTLTGSAYADSLTGGNGNDTLNGGVGNDTLSGGNGNDSLNGDNGDDSLNGGDGNDSLNGGAGMDSLVGGAGNDTYVVDTTTDTITESADAGTDTIEASVTFTLADIANVENLTLTGTVAINGTGNTLNNLVIGNFGNNTLTGGAGNDTLNGGAGADTLNGGDGTDTLTGGGGNDLLVGDAGTDTLTGSAGQDTFRFGAGVALISGTTSPSFERITDLVIGTDTLDGPNAVAAANVQQLGTIGTSLTSDSISALLTTSYFLANGASTFTFGSGGGLRTFIALNDATAGYESGTDNIIEITGYTGNFSNLNVG
jgi:Ca2+-binding RTX toxin-like protein